MTVTLSFIGVAAQPVSVTTTARGQATVRNLAAGRYSLRAEFSGFRPGTLDLAIAPGDNACVVMLRVADVEQAVTVEHDSLDRLAVFGSVLTREQIDALSDDPDELRRQLQDMAGPNAVFLVDNFADPSCRRSRRSSQSVSREISLPLKCTRRRCESRS